MSPRRDWPSLDFCLGTSNEVQKYECSHHRVGFLRHRVEQHVGAGYPSMCSRCHGARCWAPFSFVSFDMSAVGPSRPPFALVVAPSRWHSVVDVTNPAAVGWVSSSCGAKPAVGLMSSSLASRPSSGLSVVPVCVVAPPLGLHCCPWHRS